MGFEILNEHLARGALPEEGRRACRGSVGAGAEDRDEVAGLAMRHQRLIGEPVERRAEATDDVHFLVGLGGELAGDRSGIVAAYDRAEVARRGELVVQAAVGDQVNRSMAHLPVDDAREVNTGFADEIAAEFDRELG